MEILYISLFFGLVAGFGYTILSSAVILLNSNKIARIISDIVSMLVAGFCFAYFILKYNDGIIRLYVICGFVLGFLVEIISIGNLLDFSTKFVYNKIRLVIDNIKQKLLTRRIKNGAKKIK